MVSEIVSSITTPRFVAGRPFTAIDPGITYYGLAEFGASGALIRVAYVSGGHINCGLRSGIGVVEKPVVYPRSHVNARTVADLAFAAGVLLGQFETGLYVEPRNWKSTVDGTVFLRRTRRHAERIGDWPVIEGCLHHVPKRLHEHALDAYALGQWCLGALI